jgi:chlorobactene glucosyltransferase
MTTNALWVYLFIRALKSHFLTPVISANNKMIGTSTITNTMIMEPSVCPFVSVIIPARNEQNNIERCLLSLLYQNYPNFEIIAVNDNSTDGTLEIMKNIKITISSSDRLKVVSLTTDKPDGWTGKTWASQQGYLQSQGDVLLFTDADTHYFDNNTISMAVSYMHKENLDVLTGVPFLELFDFWSMIVMPLWHLFSEVFGTGMADMNNSKSNVAYLMGSFFLIKRKVLEEIGTFYSVRNDIQEDRSLGKRIKEAGYNLKIVKVNNIMSTLSSRDLRTLWNLIGRTIAPIAIESRLRPLYHLFTIFFMSALPFICLPYTLSITVVQQQFQFPLDLQFLFESDFLPLSILCLNIISCSIVITGAAIKTVIKYRLIPIYSTLVFLGAIFLTAAYVYWIIALITSNSSKPIVWRERNQK